MRRCSPDVSDVALKIVRTGDPANAMASTDAERGSAVVEFIFLASLLLVPVVYLVLVMGRLQGGAYAVAGAADQAAKVYVAATDAGSSRSRAEQAVLLAMTDHGFASDRARIDISCDPGDCQAAGTAVTVRVLLDVSLPMVPPGFRATATSVESSSTQIVGRFR